MLWVWIIVVAAVGGLVMLGVLAWWLWGKARVLGRELSELGQNLAEAADTLAEIGADIADTSTPGVHG